MHVLLFSPVWSVWAESGVHGHSATLTYLWASQGNTLQMYPHEPLLCDMQQQTHSLLPFPDIPQHFILLLETPFKTGLDWNGHMTAFDYRIGLKSFRHLSRAGMTTCSPTVPALRVATVLSVKGHTHICISILIIQLLHACFFCITNVGLCHHTKVFLLLRLTCLFSSVRSCRVPAGF